MTLRLTPLDLSNGLTTALWYAVPDYVDSRPRRALVKAGLLAGGGAMSLLIEPDLLEPVSDPEPEPVEPESAERTEGAEEEPVGESEVPTGEGTSPWVPALVLGAATATVIGVVALERSIPRLAEHLRGRGVRRPHLAVGVTLGVLTTLSGPALRAVEVHWSVQ